MQGLAERIRNGANPPQAPPVKNPAEKAPQEGKKPERQPTAGRGKKEQGITNFRL